MSSFKYNNVYIKDYFSVCGPIEKNGNLDKCDAVIEDNYFGEKTFELAEVKMQKLVIDNLLYRNKLIDSDINLLIGGDLINQISITNSNAYSYKIPYLGVYSACATFNEALLISSCLIDSSLINNSIVITSSHNLTAERQFRYPTEYGASKKLYSSHTATGGVGALLTNEKTKIKIESSTIGTPIEYGIKDANNMGAIMAPSAADTLYKHLQNLNIKLNYYDLILTGDLGKYGSILFKELCNKKYDLVVTNHKDAACLLYKDNQEVYSGGSGPVCLPLILFNKIIKDKKYKKILLLATGSLHSKVFVDQHNPLGAITHAIGLEVTR